ncbi:hypothetical protein [Arthrobacter sp. YN]|uniref:hypothetical protein n=1 Tax=Arthrobacter sp. YN TaxID=2020486 RepID=UPI0026AF1285
MHLGHHAQGPVADFAEWIANLPESPLAATPSNAGRDAWFDVKVNYQQDHTNVDINAVTAAFKPANHIFKLRGLSRDGAITVVRPDQYVANVLPLTGTISDVGLTQHGRKVHRNAESRICSLRQAIPAGSRSSRSAKFWF